MGQIADALLMPLKVHKKVFKTSNKLSPTQALLKMDKGGDERVSTGAEPTGMFGRMLQEQQRRSNAFNNPRLYATSEQGPRERRPQLDSIFNMQRKYGS